MNNEKNSRGIFARIVDLLLGFGLGESLLRVGTTLLSIVMIGAVVWLLQSFYAQSAKAGGAIEASATESIVAVEGIANVAQQDLNTFDGIPRVA